MYATTSRLFAFAGDNQYLPIDDDQVIKMALSIAERRMCRSGVFIDTPALAAEFMTLRIGSLEHEVFSVVLLDNNHQVLHYCELFRGTLTSTSVYPREVVKLALQHNAASAIFAHNHPSGTLVPSRDDERITQQLRTVLETVGVRLLDHFIVSGGANRSMAAMGLV